MPTLLEEARDALKSAPRHLTYTRIAKDTGLTVSWLSDFANDKLQDYGIKKVEMLSDYLSCEHDTHLPTSIHVDQISSLAHHEEYDCVYTIMSNEDVIYVGSTWQLGTRLRCHMRNEKIKRLNPTHVDVIYVQRNGSDNTAKLRRTIEYNRIKSLKPLLNVRGKQVA